LKMGKSVKTRFAVDTINPLSKYAETVVELYCNVYTGDTGLKGNLD